MSFVNLAGQAAPAQAFRKEAGGRPSVTWTLSIATGLWLAAAAAVWAAGPQAEITVDLARPGAQVSPELYGIFLEEINNAFDGGLYAELVQNRSFEEGVLPPGMKLVDGPDGGQRMELAQLPSGVPEDRWPMPWPWSMNCGWDPQRALVGWSLEQRGAVEGAMELTEAHPMNDASSRSLALRVSAPAGQGAVALVNSGYWGMALQADEVYRFKCYVRPGTFRGAVAAQLEAQDGRVLARQELAQLEPGEQWQQLRAELQAAGSDARGRLTLLFEGEGDLQVDWVSLFPPTYKDRPNGLRRDLAQYLEDYRPAFVRYPGGCYVQGLSWESAPDWRKMVCPPEERPGMWGYWKYRSTDGFGYHEFLEFCEDVGADAMYVAFAGMTVHPDNNWPLDEIDPVVQQTLDAIEYALGPTDSRWGAVRAKMGHPEPFPLKYVEIGNEHPPAEYGDYYVKFRDAIKAKYPDMTVIMSMYWSGLNMPAIERAGDANIDMVDEHSYRPAGWVRSNFDYFDKYPRKPWKVYVGEYAAHHAQGDLLAALDDSVYLMMLERNGDLVTMASYAPLLCNVNARSWGVNLIEFDAARSFAHPSYYVQKTFNEHRPAVNLATAAQVTPMPDPQAPLLGGRIGLGSWRTQVEFKDIKVYDEQGRLVYGDAAPKRSDFAADAIGDWEVVDGLVRQSDANQGPTVLTFDQLRLSTGRITLKARRTGGDEGFLVLFGVQSPEKFHFANFGAAGNAFSALQTRGEDLAVAFRTGKTTEQKIEEGRWYDVELVIERDRAAVSLDGVLISDSSAEALPNFFATAGYDAAGQAVIVKATNYYAEPVRATIRLENAASVGAEGQHVVVAAASPFDTNSLDAPTRIAPRTQPLPCGAEISVELPPHSANVLRIPAQTQTP